MAVQSVPQGGDELAGFHGCRCNSVQILDNVVRGVEVVNRRDVLADEILRQLAILMQNGFLRVAGILVHVIAVFVFDASIDE